METIEKLLVAHPVFKDFSPENIRLVLGCASNIIYNADQFIFQEGGEANTFYLIRSGSVVLETYSPQHGSIGIQSCGDGDVLGWSWLIPPYKWRFDARATQQTRMISIDGKCLRDKCEQDHALGYQVMKIFSELAADRLDAMRLQLLDIYNK